MQLDEVQEKGGAASSLRLPFSLGMLSRTEGPLMVMPHTHFKICNQAFTLTHAVFSGSTPVMLLSTRWRRILGALAMALGDTLPGEVCLPGQQYQPTLEFLPNTEGRSWLGSSRYKLRSC
jgi:hypothetical protein